MKLYWSKTNLQYSHSFLRKSKIVSFDSLIMKKIVAFWSRFLMKLICFASFGAASIGCFLLKSIAITLYYFFEIRIIQQTTSCIIISLTSCSFFWCYRMFVNHFYWMIKKISFMNHNNYFCSWKRVSVLTYSFCIIFTW